MTTDIKIHINTINDPAEIKRAASDGARAANFLGKTMINRETIWTETYKSQGFRIDATTDVAVLTAIHHNRSMDTLDLVAELQIEISTDGGRFLSKTNLNPEQMEQLASYLLIAANQQRKLMQLLASDSDQPYPEAA